MRKLFLFAFSTVFALNVGIAIANEAAPLADDPVVEQRLISISEEMRCLVCQNASLAGSRSDLANDLRREIRVLIKEGKSDDPLWIGPFVILAFGIAGLLAYLRRRNHSVPSVTLTDSDNQKIDALLNSSNQREG